ncbi:hypothetical protein NM208_g12523 [Fusarium decemcellulare]|uniref:Uncharacterized protein n=1 Tax=Fusarium decemcellulare TaxID=57161 RepID=A0ACC1RRU2_9HYPO|nr:hypothetical protein NM208_g12523 [Fusarium decemcellulare]
MAMTAPKTVAIIGSAIAGPTLALQILSHPILRRTFTPILFDSSPSPSETNSRAGATVGLFANGLYPLRRLGLESSIRSQGHECGALTTWSCGYDGGSERLNSQGDAMWSGDLETGVVYFERWALQKLLVERVGELGGEVNWGKKATDFSSLDNGKLSIAFEDGSNVTADLLIGADGGFSSVRKFILNQRNNDTAETRWLPDFMDLTGIYGVSSAEKATSSTAPFSDSHLIYLDKGFLATGPCPDGKTRWDLILPENSPPSSSSIDSKSTTSASDAESWQSFIVPNQYPLNSTVEILRQHRNVMHPYAGTLEALLTSADRIIRTPLRQRVWKQDEIQWGNTALIGDAARLMLPTSGQGTGFAIEDATVLARSLLRHATSNTIGGMRTALEEYARLREPRSKKMAILAALAASWSTSTSWFWKGVRYYGSKWQPDRPEARRQTGKDPWPFNERIDIDDSTR